MRIAVVSTFYSSNMGYTENCLPAALARRGHEVHLITSRLNVYGNSADYDTTYASFLGPRELPAGTVSADGYLVHRLEYRLLGGYVALRGLATFVPRLSPDVVHSTAVASFASYVLALVRPIARFRLFVECHQHLSVVRPYLRRRGGNGVKRMIFWLTRTLPGSIVGRAAERCYAVAPDCAEVAEVLYGVPGRKIQVQSLGTDTVLFHGCETSADDARRAAARSALGFGPDDIVCLYTGRLSPAKNPLVLAEAVQLLAERGLRYRSVFIGEGEQREAILACRHAQVRPFVPHTELPDLYRMADIAVWPRQESMSMLDAAASCLPIVVSAQVGERERVTGNGAVYLEDDAADLARVLEEMADPDTRRSLGETGRRKMVEHFSWDAVAKTFETAYVAAMSGTEAP